jgi:hypothetical protein
MIVMGNVNNALGTNITKGAGKMVVTGNYVNGLGSNAFTGPSYVYGSVTGLPLGPYAKTKANLISGDVALYNYINSAITHFLVCRYIFYDYHMVIIVWFFMSSHHLKTVPMDKIERIT